MGLFIFDEKKGCQLPENTDKALLQDIRDRTIRLETKLDSLDEIKVELKEVQESANRADNVSMQNTKDINEINDTLKKVMYSIGGIFVAMIIWFLQHELHIN